MPLCSVDLPLLKFLNLSHVRFNDMEDLMILIYGCPMLLILRTSHIEAGDGVTVGGGYLKPLS
ncbi:F-box/FBD/LRR-repeat protein, partial [Trifolium medium]|nr:F-box/FBD/LRR-repeat protein [Trifolium medium]